MLFWTKIKVVAALAALVVLAGPVVGTSGKLAQAATRTGTALATTTQTITGVSKALPAYNPDKMNPSVANATVTVSANGTDTVYYVYGWAGIICAKNDGKTVEVTGAVRTTSIGQLTITARSVDVKVIVVQ